LPGGALEKRERACRVMVAGRRRVSLLSAQFSVLNSRCSVLIDRCSVLSVFFFISLQPRVE